MQVKSSKTASVGIGTEPKFSESGSKFMYSTQCTDSLRRELESRLRHTHSLIQRESSNQLLIITANLMSAQSAKGIHCDSPVKKKKVLQTADSTAATTPGSFATS